PFTATLSTSVGFDPSRYSSDFPPAFSNHATQLPRGDAETPSISCFEMRMNANFLEATSICARPVKSRSSAVLAQNTCLPSPDQHGLWYCTSPLCGVNCRTLPVATSIA